MGHCTLVTTGQRREEPPAPQGKEARVDGKGRRIARVVAGAGAVVALGALVAANVAVVLLGDTVNSYLGIGEQVVVSEERRDATMAAGRALAERVEGEGIVLLRNEDAALPLPADVRRVNVFGWASTQWVASGSGSGQVAGSTMGLLDALSEAGLSYNERLADMYRDFCGERTFASAGALNSHASEFCRLFEPSVRDESCYTPELLEDARAFSDTALVVIGRVSGESIDCPQAQHKVVERGGELEIDASRGYLELSREEEDLLRYVGATYERVVVLVNSTNAMELGELETIPGIDAALLVGATGEVGARAVVDVLTGATNPSGRTTDTYAYDFATAASWANAGELGEGRYLGAEGLYPADGTLNVNVGVTEPYDAVRFVDYAEGIYVGYRWYETADAEGFWDGVENEHGTGYDGVVQYPFGFGLSYTDFSWEVVERSHASGASVGRDTSFSVVVRVTNTGSVAGRDVVQLYCSAPYHAGGIEKAAWVLVGYQKTGLLEPGESQDVTVSFLLDDVASFDHDDANANGFAGYELEAGDYAVELRHNAHEPAACARARTTLRVPATILCRDDLATGAEVTSRFTGGSAVDGVSVDGSDSGAGLTYLSRADFAGTFPSEPSPDREMTDNVRALNLYGEDQVKEDAQAYEELVARGEVSLGQPLASTTSAVLTLTENGQLTAIARHLGEKYESAVWDTLLDSLSVDDMSSLVLHGYLATGRIKTLSKPLTKEVDGPAQVGSFNQLASGVGYPGPTVLAQTWNPGLAREYGRQLGLEAAVLGVDGLYAPCADLHRTPIGGRNYEYYAEDPLVCGVTAREVTAGAREAGTYCFLKHFAVNNQDSYRDGLYTWLTEQALRELYLRPFQIAVRGGITGVMTSYNRVGAVWAGGSTALLSEVLRGEWGFAGAVITDYADHQQYMNADQALRAGSDLYMDGVFRNGSFAFGFDSAALARVRGTGDEALAASYVTNLRRATKDVLYVWLNARAANLAYNEQARATGAPTLDRPLKTESFNWLGTGLALLDAAAATFLITRLFRPAGTRDKPGMV